MRSWLAAVTRQRSIRVTIQLISRYLAHDIARQGAALAYYLLFSLFPLTILVSSLIGQLKLDLSGVLDTVSPLLPEEVLRLAQTYLVYVSEHVSRSMLWFSAVFSVWFPLRATRCLLRSIRAAYSLGAPKHRLRYLFRVVFFTVLLLFCLVTTLLLMTVGSKWMHTLSSIFPLPRFFPRTWSLIRFIVLGAIIFATVFALYAAAQDVRCPIRTLFPGAALATFAWLTLSFGYSFYTENITQYSTVYGALDTVVVLLIWLYLTAVTLILGAEFNHILLQPDAISPPQHRRFNQGEQL